MRSREALAHVVAEEAGNVGRVAATRWVPKTIPLDEWVAVPAAGVDAPAQKLSARVANLEFDDAVDVSSMRVRWQTS